MDPLNDEQPWFAIVNPNAGKGKGKKDWDQISGLLEKAGLRFFMKFTESKGHAMRLVREAVINGSRKIMTIGGDGTLNEVVNGVFIQNACASQEITLASIPVGTGNDWGRMFGIGTVYVNAVDIIREGRSMLHDIGVADFQDESGQKRRYFINIAGLGFESEVVRKTNYQKDRGHGGKTIYFYNLLTSLLAYRNTPAEIIIDGERKSAEIFSINIGNGRYCGGGMRQTPDALPDDGLLDVTVINGMGKLEIIRNLNILYNGKIHSHPKVDGYRCKNLKIISEKKIWVEADGESLGHTPAEFSILPASIRIIYGVKLIP
jgi:YegS/Rv2252/BmrU family lipid kinase